MAKFLVTKTKTYEWSYVVDAETKEDAEEAVERNAEDGNICEHYCGSEYSIQEIEDEKVDEYLKLFDECKE